LPCFLAAALAVGCDDEPTAPEPGEVLDLSRGPYSIRVDTGAREITLLRDGAALLRFPADALQLGSVAEVSDTVNYDPHRLYVPSPLYAPLNDLEWLEPASMTIAERGEGAIALALEYPRGKTATLRIEAPAEGRFGATLTPDPTGPAIAFVRLRPRIDAAEGLYGLGEYFDDVNHRGKVRAMQIEIDTRYESGYNEAHVPVPLLIGTTGWGLYVDSRRPGTFAVAIEADDRVEAAFGMGVASSEGLAFHLFAAGHPLDVTKRYYDVTGAPRLPARWALGPWVWRDENEDQAEVEADVEAIRDLDLATTGYWIDRPYATAVNTFDFNPAQFPDPQAMIDRVRALGLRTALWHTPYLDEKDQAADTADLREEAEQNGYYPADTGILLNKWGRPIDVTSPGARAFWQDLLGRYTEMGVAGFKLDYGEDVVVGVTQGREPWVFADGSDERTMNKGFANAYHSMYAELLPEDGGFLLCRAGAAGDQVNGPIIWPGDLDASFARYGDEVEDGDDDYVAVGGLPASMIAGLTLGPSGFPFYGSDTGGYRHSPPDKELFTRWFQQTALSTVMQIGNSASTVAWEPSAETGYDEEMLSWYREYTRLHLRLFPYVWTYATRLAEDGRPIQRALGLAYPELGEHPSDEYLFGDSLLVAPVLDRGQSSREVLFPPGRWIDWWTGEVHEGGQRETVDAPLERLPLFLAEGGLVPMLRPTIDAMAPTSEPDRVDSYATTPGVLYVRLAAGAESSFALFDGAEVAQKLEGSALELRSKDGAELAHGVLFEVVAFGAAPASVEEGGATLVNTRSLANLEGAESGFAYDSELGGTLFVKVPPGAHTVTITR
jgi:alpha-D-xyloside xylohydrolase